MKILKLNYYNDDKIFYNIFDKNYYNDDKSCQYFKKVAGLMK